jgi:hypothetical protein
MTSDDDVRMTMTTTMVKDKTRVPSSDRHAVLSAIDNQINSAKVVWQSKYLTNVLTNSSKVDFIINELEIMIYGKPEETDVKTETLL